MHDDVNIGLREIYDTWKAKLSFDDEQSAHLSPPLLLSAQPSYKVAKQRIIFFGQETFGWSWTKDYMEFYKDYPKKEYKFLDVSTFGDFYHNSDAVEALMWGYDVFDFARYQPITRRSPFWQAFREVRSWSQTAGLIWNNCSRFDYDGGSVLWAPQDIRDALVNAQGELIYKELHLLKPNICIFFTGPNYDWFLERLFPDLERKAIDDAPLRSLCRIAHPNLPLDSFRTYHPAYLSRARLWHHISKIRDVIEQGE